MEKQYRALHKLQINFTATQYLFLEFTAQIENKSKSDIVRKAVDEKLQIMKKENKEWSEKWKKLKKN